MNYIELQNFLSCYGLPTIIIAIIVTAACLLLNYFLKEKMSLQLKTYLPAVIAIILQFIYDCIFVFHCINFSEQTFYAGLMSSSLATVFSVAITKLFKGEKVSDEPLKILIEGIIKGYVKKKALSKAVDLIFGFVLEEKDELEIIKNVKNTLLEYQESEVVFKEIDQLSTHVVKSAKSLKE